MYWAVRLIIDFIGKVLLDFRTNTTYMRKTPQDAKRAAGIPTSQQYDTHGFVYDGNTENRTVFKFSSYGENKYIILGKIQPV